MTRAARAQIRGFGFDPVESPYHFAVVRGRNEESPVWVEERFGFEDLSESGSVRDPLRKVELDAYSWSRIEAPARAEFNRRLQGRGQRTASWQNHETLLAPYLGKELTLLAWAVEGADPTVIPNVIANWRGLAPEERWWLYTTVNATSGHPEHGRDRGWRKAIKIALAENPSVAVTPGTMELTEAAVSRPRADAGPQKRRRRALGHPQPIDQLTLLAEDPP
jgi:hypothetical protein